MKMICDFQTLGFYDHTDPVPSQVLLFDIVASLHLAGNSISTEMHTKGPNFLRYRSDG